MLCSAADRLQFNQPLTLRRCCLRQLAYPISYDGPCFSQYAFLDCLPRRCYVPAPIVATLLHRSSLLPSMVPDYSDSRKVGFTGRLRSAAGVAAVQGAGAKYRWTRLRCAGSAAGCHIQHAVKLAIHALQPTAFIAAMSLRSSHGSARCHRESRCVPPLHSREGTAVCRPRRTPVTSVTGTCARRGSRGGSTVDSAGHAQPRSIRPSSCVRAWLRTRHGRARWSLA